MCVCMNEKREFVCSLFCLLPVASWLFAVEYLRSVCRLSIFAATAWRSEEAKSCVCVFVRVCTCEPPSMVCRIFARHLRARTRCGSGQNCAERSAWHGDGSLLRRTPLHPLRSPLTRRMREDLKRRLAWDLRAGLRGGLRKRQRGGRRGRGGTRRRTLIEHGSGKARNDA